MPSSRPRWTSSLGADAAFSFRALGPECFSLIFPMVCHLPYGGRDAGASLPLIFQAAIVSDGRVVMS